MMNQFRAFASDKIHLLYKLSSYGLSMLLNVYMLLDFFLFFNKKFSVICGLHHNVHLLMFP